MKKVLCSCKLYWLQQTWCHNICYFCYIKQKSLVIPPIFSLVHVESGHHEINSTVHDVILLNKKLIIVLLILFVTFIIYCCLIMLYAISFIASVYWFIPIHFKQVASIPTFNSFFNYSFTKKQLHKFPFFLYRLYLRLHKVNSTFHHLQNTNLHGGQYNVIFKPKKISNNY